MAKKPYLKPEVKSQKIELGVYGCYDNDGGGNTTPLLPIRPRNKNGDLGLDG